MKRRLAALLILFIALSACGTRVEAKSVSGSEFDAQSLNAYIVQGFVKLFWMASGKTRKA